MKKTILLGFACVALGGCSAMTPQDKGSVNLASSLGDGSALVGKSSIVVADANGVVYDESSTALVLKAGVPYSVNAVAANAPAGVSFLLEATRIDVVGASPATMPLPGTFTPPAQGQYSFRLIATSGSQQLATKSYVADVTCANPAPFNLVGTTVSASLAASNNVFNFSVSLPGGGPAGAMCALDPTGNGVQNTAFQSCSQAFSNIYSNYVGARNVGVIVRDSCNVTQQIAAPATLAHSTPGMPGNVFIQGRTTSPVGNAAGDSRVDAVDYLATNVNGVNPVQPMYQPGSFTMIASYKYGMLSSIPFGMKIVVSGLPQPLDLTVAQSIDMSSANITTVEFTTDQAGDSRPSRSFRNASCTYTNKGGRVLMVAGTPCSGSGNQAPDPVPSVEVWGNYSCRINDGLGASVQIDGSFDGAYRIEDACAGGGGGGGGVVPIQL